MISGKFLSTVLNQQKFYWTDASLGHGTRIKIKELKNSIYNKHFPGTFSNSVNVYIIPFTSDPIKAFNGVLENYYYFDGSKMQLSLTPGTGFSGASYVIDCYAYIMKQIYEIGGRFSVKY